MEDYSDALAAVSLTDPVPMTAGPGQIVTLQDGKPTRWVDVLPLLDSAADEMKLGDLLAGRSFDLQDAMSALEMMDPQMDTGMKAAASTEAEAPIPTAPDELPAPLLVGLLDDVLCAEHGWYRGLTLAQTVYAVEWMQCAPELAHLPTRASLLATARAVAAARSIILRADTHEEEDFAGTVNGLKLHDKIVDVDVAALLNAAEEQCAVALKAARAAHAEATAGGAAAEAEAEAAAAVAAAEAVLCRVRFRRGYCCALLHMARPSAKALEMAKRMLKMADEQLAAMASSIEIGTPRSELADLLDGRAVRKRLGAAPAKKPAWLPRAEGIAASKTLLAELRHICSVSEASDDYDGIVRWVDDLAGLPRPGPHVLTRSAAQLIGVSEDPRQACGLRPPMIELIASAVSTYGGLEAPLARELLTLPPVHDLLQQLAQGELSRLRLRNINRGRQRRRLRHYLADWAPLQELAETVDTQLQQAGYLEPGVGPYGAWCLHRTLRDMIAFIMLGFELELFAPCEFGFAYWYNDLLCGMQLQLHREVSDKAQAQAAALAAEANARQAAAAAGGKKAKKGKGKEVKPRPVVCGSPATHLELLFAKVSLDMSRGCYLLLSALENGCAAALRQTRCVQPAPPHAPCAPTSRAHAPPRREPWSCAAASFPSTTLSSCRSRGALSGALPPSMPSCARRRSPPARTSARRRSSLAAWPPTCSQWRVSTSRPSRAASTGLSRRSRAPRAHRRRRSAPRRWPSPRSPSPTGCSSTHSASSRRPTARARASPSIRTRTSSSPPWRRPRQRARRRPPAVRPPLVARRKRSSCSAVCAPSSAGRIRPKSTIIWSKRTSDCWARPSASRPRRVAAARKNCEAFATPRRPLW
jgi:hypothetical protein